MAEMFIPTGGEGMRQCAKGIRRNTGAVPRARGRGGFAARLSLVAVALGLLVSVSSAQAVELPPLGPTGATGPSGPTGERGPTGPAGSGGGGGEASSFGKYTGAGSTGGLASGNQESGVWV